MRTLSSFTALLLSSCLAAHAEPITYTIDAHLTGTIGTTAFTNAIVIFTEVGEGNNIMRVGPDSYTVQSLFSTVTISGIGTATVFDSTLYAYARPQGSYENVGFADQGNLFGIGLRAGPAGYTLSSGSGGSGDVSAGGMEATSLGTLVITRAGAVGTFNAETPEPSSLMLLGTGVLGVAGAMRRRLRR